MCVCVCVCVRARARVGMNCHKRFHLYIHQDEENKFKEMTVLLCILYISFYVQYRDMLKRFKLLLYTAISTAKLI